ncbi:MAG: hypothetical protein II820_07970 [Ruminiclostridium sp.]|nr:hypothetical protein [Ruminiclostridium sp.]
MERILNNLFDFQRFVRDPALQRIIDEAENYSEAVELSDDILGLAAGGIAVDPDKIKGAKNG